MIRRTLQFVLMLAVVVSASVAQASAMPCCQIAAVHVATSAPAVEDSGMSMEHCHGDMHPATASLHEMASCASPACAQQADVATTPSDETVLLVPSAFASTVVAFTHADISAHAFVSNAQSHQPDTPRYSPLPLRL